MSKNKSLYAKPLDEVAKIYVEKQETKNDIPVILEKEQSKNISSFDMKNAKPNVNITTNIKKQLDMIAIPEVLENEKEHWLKIIGMWLVDNAVPIIEIYLRKFAEGMAKGSVKDFNINKATSFKSFKNYIDGKGL